MAFTSEQYQDAFAVATQHINKSIPDLMANKIFLLKKLYDNKVFKSGGTFIQFPVNHKELASKGFINGSTDVISTNPNQMFTYGELNWKYYYHTVAITLDDLTKTQDSKEAIISLMMGKANAAKGSIARELAEIAYSTGTAANKRWNGMADIFAASGTAYAGLLDTDFDTADAWLPEIDTTTNIVSYTNISRMIGKLRTRTQGLFNQSTGKEYKVDTMLSNYAVREKYLSAQQIQQRFVDAKNLDSGFDIVRVNGVDWAVDSYCPGSADNSTADNYLYILSFNSMMLFYKYGIDRDPPLKQTKNPLPDQPIMINVGYIAGNMACENRRVNGVFKNLIA